MDPLLSTVEYAMGGLQLRLDTVANNLANLNTPGFVAQKVDFETSLGIALASGRGAPGVGPAIVNSEDVPDDTGNTVNIENEITEMTKSSLERQVMVSAFNYKTDLLKAAAGVSR